MLKRRDISKQIIIYPAAILLFMVASSSVSSACIDIPRVVTVSQKFSIQVLYGKIPISDARVEISPNFSYDGKAVSLRTDSQGAISQELKSGTYSMWIGHAGLSDNFILEVANTPAGIDRVVQWADWAKSIARLRGRVLYAEKPSRVASGTVVTVNDAITGKQVVEIHADEGGAFDAGPLRPGLYAVSFDFKPDTAPGVVAVQPLKISDGAKTANLRVTLMNTDCGPTASIDLDTELSIADTTISEAQQQAPIVMVPPLPVSECPNEVVSPNLVLTQSTHVSGSVRDQQAQPFRLSAVIVRRVEAPWKQVDFKTVNTNESGQFDLGTITKGEYRLLASPHRGFSQPANLDCNERTECNLEITLKVKPTDQDYDACPIK